MSALVMHLGHLAPNKQLLQLADIHILAALYSIELSNHVPQQLDLFFFRLDLLAQIVDSLLIFSSQVFEAHACHINRGVLCILAGSQCRKGVHVSAILPKQSFFLHITDFLIQLAVSGPQCLDISQLLLDNLV